MRIIDFFRKDIWKEQVYDPHHRVRSFFIKVIRTIITTANGFINDECFAKASALTFYTLLAIVPMLAIGLGIAGEFGIQDTLKTEIQKQFESQPVIAEKIIQFATAALDQTKGGWFQSIGILFLIYTVLGLISNIETFFNQIWKITDDRSIWAQYRRYIVLIIFFPILIFAISFITVFLTTITATSSHYLGAPWLVTIVRIFVPFIVYWIFFTFLYIYIPIIHVRWSAGLIAGFIIAILYNIWQWIYVTFQVKAASYGAVYGSFAAVPLFLIWLNYSWLIVLLGTEITCHFQEENTFYRKEMAR